MAEAAASFGGLGQTDATQLVGQFGLWTSAWMVERSRLTDERTPVGRCSIGKVVFSSFIIEAPLGGRFALDAAIASTARHDEQCRCDLHRRLSGAAEPQELASTYADGAMRFDRSKRHAT
jgi:hypothetical protein